MMNDAATYIDAKPQSACEGSLRGVRGAGAYYGHWRPLVGFAVLQDGLLLVREPVRGTHRVVVQLLHTAKLSFPQSSFISASHASSKFK